MHRSYLQFISPILLAPMVVWPLGATPITWTGVTDDGKWSTAGNWDPVGEPTSASEVLFPADLGTTITTTTTENALSLSFADDYTLSGGTLALASGNSISTAADVTAAISNNLTITGGLIKTGPGTLILQGSNTNVGGTEIQQGKIRAQHIGAMGASGAVTTIEDGAILEIAPSILFDRPITLQNGGTLAGSGASSSLGVMTVDSAADALVHLATSDAADVFIIGNGANDLTGGSDTTVIQPTGPGTVRLGAASDFEGSWLLDQGRLELANINSLGNDPTQSVTLAGGTLSASINSGTSFTGSPGNQILVTANSTILSDRVSTSSGVSHTFGSLAMGGQTLTISPGPNATSGTATITLGTVTLTGNPQFQIANTTATGRLAITSLTGGASPRTITKSGAGELAITGGTTNLVAGSSLDFSGGGMLDLIFADLGTDAVISVSAAQNPLGEASLSFADGTIKLQANGANNANVQTYQISTPITLSGEVVLDPLRRTNALATNKTYELSGLTLAANTELSVSGANTHGIRLTGPLTLQGDAALGGVNVSTRSGLLTLAGGISGDVGDSLEIRDGTSPLNLTISAASAFGGGTTITGGNVTLTAENALGSGPIEVSGGKLITIGVDLLAGNAVTVNGGILEIRNNSADSFSSAALNVSGTSTLDVRRIDGSTTSQVITLPNLNVVGTTTLTLTNGNSYIPTISNLHLGGDLTLNNGITARVGAITEDASPRVLLKSGLGTLELEGASDHSGGTEVLAGILLVKHQDALGAGTLTLGDISGSGTATANFNAGLTITNDLVARTGSSGALTLGAAGGNLTWSGDVSLQRALVLNNAISNLSSTLSGQITGSGTLSKTGVGEWILSNATNSFGGGEVNAISIGTGTLTVAADGAMGNAANGITLTSTGVFSADGSFSTNRAFTFSGSGSSTGIQVTGSNTLTVNSPLAGTGVLNKTGTGILEIGPSVDSSAARGPAANTTNISAGTLRVQSAKGLGNGTPLSASGGTLELLADANTDFSHPFTVTSTADLLVDRAIGGSGTNGRHQLGTLALNANANLTVNGGNGYGLTFGDTTLTGSQTLSNQSIAPLLLGDLIANPANGSRTFTIGGAGDIHVEGSMNPSSAGSYGITKNGAGTFRFGTDVSTFNGALAVRDGTIDLNGLDHTIGLLTLGGATSVNGATVVTGAAGSLTLTNGLTFGTGVPAPDSFVIGNVVLDPVSHTFFIPSSTGATTEVTIDGPLTGSPGSGITKTSSGKLRFAGSSGNTPGPVAVNGGTLELAKTAGVNAVGIDALTLNGGTVRLFAANQIPDSTPVTIGNTLSSTLDLNGFTETVGGATLTQSGNFNSSIIATGTDGTLVLAGDLILNNNGNSTGNISRNILITGTGTHATAVNDGTLDLGGETRTIHVDTTTDSSTTANATIETRIINGGIIKTGPQKLFLTNSSNTFADGLRIEEGTVSVTNFAALGTGPVTFAHSSGGSSALDFGTTTGTLGGDLTINGSGAGSATLIFSGAAPQSLTLTGNIDLQSSLSVNVVNGSLTDDGGALFDLTGTLDDGAETSGLVKLGQGILRLAAGNTYSGSTTVQKGVLSIPSDDALGDTDAVLTLDGGILHATAAITSPRDLVFGPNGGGLRINAPGTLEFTGDVTWDTGTTSFHGSGMTILSGASTGAGGNLLIGRPMEFATPSFYNDQPVASGHVLSMRGDVALPAGNIEITNGAILVLGSSDFIRPLGEGSGQFHMPSSTVGGWAAHGADRIVNIDGDGPIVWGQESPRFLSRSGTNTRGRLVLGHSTATHTVDFQSVIELNSSLGGSTRRVDVGDGTATLDALLSGGFSNTPDPTVRNRTLWFTGDGDAEISGPLVGRIYVDSSGPGDLTLSGNNSAQTGGLFVNGGTIRIAGDASLGAYDYIEIWEDGVIDFTALTGPVTLDPPEDGYLGVEGTLLGSAIAPSYFYGNGEITGSLTAPINSYIEPGYDRMLHIGGNYSLEAGAIHGLYISGSLGLVPDEDFNRTRVTGTVTLAGELDWYASDLDTHIGETIVFILNDGDDAVVGQFAGLDEGDVIQLGGGLALQITYQANGDGGSVGNDVALTVIAAGVGPDVAVVVDGPSNVAPGEEFQVTFTVSNAGVGAANGLSLVIMLPSNAEFVESDPAGTLLDPDGESGNERLEIDLDGLPEGASTQITITFTAPVDPGTVWIDAYLEGAIADANQDDNSASLDVIVAVFDGPLTLTNYTFDPVAGTGELTLDTLAGRSYVLQRSDNLANWQDIQTYIGDGNPLTIPLILDEAPEFFRVKLLPGGIAP